MGHKQGPVAQADLLFPPGSIIKHLTGRGLLLFGGPTALLEQIAHPLVAAGVDDWSKFQQDPFDRLHKVLRFVYAVVYGTKDQAAQACDHVRQIHEQVQGVAHGRAYHANDPELLLWVYSTLVHTTISMYDSMAPRPLSVEQSEEFYAQSRIVMSVIGIPTHLQPAKVGDLKDYFDEMVTHLEVSEEARRLAHDVLRPNPIWTIPVRPVVRNITAYLLPETLRLQYGLEVSPYWMRVLQNAGRTSRIFAPLIPDLVQTIPVRVWGPGPMGLAGPPVIAS